MQEIIERIGDDLAGRLHGPLTFRLILQPAMALFLAIRAGLRDARACRPAYFWAALTDPAHRHEIVHGGWKDISRVFGLAVLLDVVYQLAVFQKLYLLEVLIVAILLAVLPYTLVRGPVNRLFRKDCPKAGDQPKNDRNERDARAWEGMPME